MARKIESSVAPKERINIVYKPATGGLKAKTELPLKVMILADLTKKKDNRSIEGRKPIDLNQSNLDEVIASLNITTEYSVPNMLSGIEDDTIDISLNIDSMADLSPDSIVNSVDELKKIIELRDALKAMRGPIGNVPKLRQEIQLMVSDEGSRAEIIEGLGIDKA